MRSSRLILEEVASHFRSRDELIARDLNCGWMTMKLVHLVRTFVALFTFGPIQCFVDVPPLFRLVIQHEIDAQNASRVFVAKEMHEKAGITSFLALHLPSTEK